MTTTSDDANELKHCPECDETVAPIAIPLDTDGPGEVYAMSCPNCPIVFDRITEADFTDEDDDPPGHHAP